MGERLKIEHNGVSVYFLPSAYGGWYTMISREESEELGLYRVEELLENSQKHGGGIWAHCNFGLQPGSKELVNRAYYVVDGGIIDLMKFLVDSIIKSEGDNAIIHNFDDSAQADEKRKGERI